MVVVTGKVIEVAVIGFVVVLVGSKLLGHWLQDKGRDLEKGPKDASGR